MKKKVLALIGGISKDSLNKKFYRALKEHAPTDVSLETFDISRLPFFSQDIENDLPASVREFKKQIEDSEALLFITPEYNRSFPGVLKNALDWGSRPPNSNSWDGKKGAVVGASSGSIGTFGAQNHLRQVLMHLNIQVMAQPEVYFNGGKAFNDQGELQDERARELIKKFWVGFEKWTR